MFDPIQSIQRWEYEGGRILQQRNGTLTSRDQNRWFPTKPRANAVNEGLNFTRESDTARDA